MASDFVHKTIRQWMSGVLSPGEPWFYLWKPAHEQGISDALDVACGYQAESEGWTLDAVAYGEPLVVPQWSSDWMIQMAPILASCKRGKPQDGGFQQGVFLRSPIANFNSAFLIVGRFDFISVAEFNRAVKKATPVYRSGMGLGLVT